MGVVKLADYRHNPVQHQEASSMGYVSIHRQFMDSRLYKDSQAVHLWLHLILKANHESTVVNTDIGPITVDRGQMITGRPSLVRETFIPDNKVRSLLRTFESKGMLNICSMGKKFSLFTIVKYDDFQSKNCPTVVQRLSNANTSNGAALSGDCPTVVQRLSINNNINNISNTDVLESATADKKSDKKKPSVSCQDVVDAYHEILPEAPRSANGPQWCVLKTGLYDDVYRAIDFIYEGNQITCGDKLESVTGKLQFDISSQYDKQQEHLLFTPLFKADNARCFDLEVESSTGVAQYADRLFLSATTDGINYGREQMIEQNEPFIYDKRVLWKRVGRIRKNVGFKLRVITKSPVTLSGCQIRIE